MNDTNPCKDCDAYTETNGCICPKAGSARLISTPSQDELGLPDPDMAATGDGRMIVAAINSLTEQVAILVAVLSARGSA